MSQRALPSFRYHPDPLATGSVEPRSDVCVACERARGYIYVGPVYAEDELEESLCPWCIADGTAARRFSAAFIDIGVGVPADVPASVLDEVSSRTPGFTGWQQEHWLYHCGDAATFLGSVGSEELESYPEAREMLLHEHDEYGMSAGDSWKYVAALDKDGGATAYLFRCLHCNAHVAYSDFE